MALRPASPEGDTRQHILQRAITLFAGAGYAGVSVRDVATSRASSRRWRASAHRSSA